MKRMLLVIAGIGLLSSVSLGAQEPQIKADEFFRKAQEAYAQKDQLKTNFWLVRFLGESLNNRLGKKILADLKSALSRHPINNSFWTVPSWYSQSFTEWFFQAPKKQWAVLDSQALESSSTSELAGGSLIVDSKTEEAYYARIYGAPQVEGWSLGPGQGQDYLITVSPLQKPVILSGRSIPRVKAIFFRNVPMVVEDKPIQYFWKPTFEDLDGDQVPEMFLRYNIIDRNNFYQELAVYRFVKGEPVLMKKFTSRLGGVARHIGNKQIEIAQGSEDGNVLLFEVFLYQNGFFAKSSVSRTEGNILKNDDWKKYY